MKVELTAAFLMVDIEPISFYLGLKVERNREKQTIKLFQRAYIDKILSKFHLDQAHPSITSMKEFALLQLHIEGQVTIANKEKY